MISELCQDLDEVMKEEKNSRSTRHDSLTVHSAVLVNILHKTVPHIVLTTNTMHYAVSSTCSVDVVVEPKTTKNCYVKYCTTTTQIHSVYIIL